MLTTVDSVQQCFYLVQHKKLPEWADGNEWKYTVTSEEGNMDIDLTTSVKNGMMYLEDPVDHVRFIQELYHISSIRYC